MKTPILAEVTHTKLNDLENCYGLKTQKEKTYAIIGYVYDDVELW